MSDVADLSELTGIEQLRHFLGKDARPIGIGVTLGFRLVELEEGRVVFEGTPGKHVYNPIGTVHGGYAATLLDSAVGCAVHRQAFHIIDLIGHIRLDERRTVDGRARLHVGERHTADTHADPAPP